MIASEATGRTFIDFVVDTGLVGAGAAFISIVAVALLNAALNRRTQRRERYAAMAATLAAWAEVPYLVRRRTSNDKNVIDSLTLRIHEIQQQLVVDGADLRADSNWLANERDRAQAAIQSLVVGWIEDAWNQPPISATAEMNLGDWGPRCTSAEVQRFACEVRWRFGWRRLISLGRRCFQRGRVRSCRPRHCR